MIGFKELVVIFCILVFILGGKGRISSFFSDLGRGLGAFRKGLNDAQNNFYDMEDSHSNPEDFDNDAPLKNKDIS